MFLNRLSARTGSAIGIVLVGLLAGCSSGDSSIGPGGNTTSQVRTFNALVCPDFNTVNFAQRNSSANITPGIAYGQVSGWNTLAAGNGIQNFVVQNGTVEAQASYDLHPNQSYTIVAAGDCKQTTASGVAPSVIQFTDATPTAAQLGNNVAVRVINVAPSTTAGYQNIDLYNAGQPVAGLTNVGYGNATGYATLPAATYNLTVHSHANNALLTLPPTTTTSLASLPLVAGHAYTLFVTGTTTGVPNEAFDVKVVQDL